MAGDMERSPQPFWNGMYGRDHKPKEPEPPKHFDPMRPFRWIIFAFLWYCWRMTSLEQSRWDGTHEKAQYGLNADHSGPTWVLWLASLVVWGISAFATKLVWVFLVSTGIFLSNILMCFIVKAMFGLHDLDARLYWKEKLLK